MSIAPSHASIEDHLEHLDALIQADQVGLALVQLFGASLES